MSQRTDKEKMEYYNLHIVRYKGLAEAVMLAWTILAIKKEAETKTTKPTPPVSQKTKGKPSS